MFRKKWFWICAGARDCRRRRGGGVRAARRDRARRSRWKRSRSATSRRSSRRRARSSRRRPSTSAPRRWAASRSSAVKEGDRVRAGQFLLQIDPVTAEAAVRRDDAGVAGARTALEQSRVGCRARARQPRRGAAEPQAPAGTVERRPDHARDARARAGRSRSSRERPARRASRKSRTARRSSISRRPASAAASTPWRRCASTSPIDGIVTRRNIEEGENVGGRHDEQRRHRAADGRRHVGDRGRGRGRRDRHPVRAARASRRRSRSTRSPTRTFTGRVTEIGNSPIQAAGARHDAHRRRTSRSSSPSTDRFPRCVPASPARRRSRRRPSKQVDRRCRFRR